MTTYYPTNEEVATGAAPTFLLNAAIADFLEAKAIRATKTVTYYSLTLRAFAENFPAWPPKSADINKFLMAAQRRGCKATTVDDYYRAIRAWLNWLCAMDRLENNPILLVTKPSRPRILPRAPQETTLQKLFSHLGVLAHEGRGHWKDVQNLAAWSLAFDTGLRIGELVALDMEDITIDSLRRSAFINGQKTHTDRIVVFSEPCAQAILNWQQVRTGLQDWKDDPLPKAETALFTSWQRGRWGRMTDWGFRQSLKEMCKELEIPHINPHKMRNAYATYYLRHGGALNDVQAQLGHASLTTTARYVMADDIGRGKRHEDFSPFDNLGGAA
jgi:integrase/recombinase XerC